MQESGPRVTLLAPDCCIFVWRVLYRQACSLISQLMTVVETVLPAPGEILDMGRVDLLLSIMHSFKQEMASESLFFFFKEQGGDTTAATKGSEAWCTGVKTRLRCLAFCFQIVLLSE